MLLEGSCHCGAVSFRVESETPYPYQACYCSICRKTAGGGGYAINLGAAANTLEIEGKENLSVYNAKLYDRGGPGEIPASEAERNFCRFCGSSLWLYSPSYPDLVHPFASAVDTPLPKPRGARSRPEKARGTSPSIPRNLSRSGTAATDYSPTSEVRCKNTRSPARS
jgi:hypothetical protein